MGKYNFDKFIERKGTLSLKYDLIKERFGREDLIPLWVADMDFETPPVVTEAIVERAKHGIFGYTFASEDYYNSIINWLGRRHQWKVNKEEITYIPGIVKGIAFVLDTFSKEGDNVIIQPPVYHPFRIIPNHHNRKVINNPLICENNQYRMDFDGLKEILRNTTCKIFILCNPHNPGGRVWNKEELEELASICYDHQVLVISDEIHSDIIHPGYRHTPFATVSEKAEQNSITFMAPSKTFNIAGLYSSYSIIKNKEIREKYNKFLKSSELNEGNIFAYLALQVAYDHAEDWLEELKDYIWKNALFVEDYLKTNIPEVKAILPQASFLLWLDCRELNLEQRDLVSLFVNKAQLALNDGSMFGKEGRGFMRINLGCPRLQLEKSLEKLKKAIKN